MVVYHDVLQGSEEWDILRSDKFTASKATPIGANGKGLETYAKEIVLKNMGIFGDNYTNSDFDRGNELEPVGRTAYEFDQNVIVKEIGFVTNTLYPIAGASPDGLIGEDGGIEIKARNDKKHFDLILGNETDIPFNQIQMCLLITERKWWDFVSINTNFSKHLFIKRIYPDKVYHEKLCNGFAIGKKLIKQYLEQYQNYK